MFPRPSLVLCVLVLLADGVGPVHAYSASNTPAASTGGATTRPHLVAAGRDHRRVRAVPRRLRLEGAGDRSGAWHPTPQRPPGRAGVALDRHGRPRPSSERDGHDRQRRRRRHLEARVDPGAEHARVDQPQRDGGGGAGRRPRACTERSPRTGSQAAGKAAGTMLPPSGGRRTVLVPGTSPGFRRRHGVKAAFSSGHDHPSRLPPRPGRRPRCGGRKRELD